MSAEVQPVSPVEDTEINERAVALEWQAATGADNYQLQIALDPGFDDPIFEGRVGDTTRFAVSGLPGQEGVRLYWRVRPRIGETWEDFGPTASFVLTDWTPDASPLDPSKTDGAEAAAAAEAAAPAATARQSLGAPSMLAVMVVLAIASVAGLYVLSGPSASSDPAPEAASAQVPEPDTSDRDLRRYQVVDEEAGVYQIPIDSAMKDIVRTRGGAWR